MPLTPTAITTRSSTRRRLPRRLRRAFAAILALTIVVGLVLLTLLFQGRFPQPSADHLASAHNQLLLALLALSLIEAAVLSRHWLRPIPPILVLTFWLGQMLALPVAPSWSESDGPSLRLLSLNAQGDMQNLTTILRLIEETDPDVVCLQEASGDKTDIGDALAEAYPYQLPSRPGFGWFTTLLSRHPIEPVDQAPRRVMATYEQGALQSAIVHAPQGSVLIGTCHLIRGHEHRAIRSAGNRAASQVGDRLAAQAREFGLPAILAGDLNGGPFSARGRNLRAGGDWLLAQPPYPWHGTWPSHLPALLRVQPDQIYVTTGLSIRRQRVGGSVDSDHRPIIADIGWHR